MRVRLTVKMSASSCKVSMTPECEPFSAGLVIVGAERLAPTGFQSQPPRNSIRGRSSITCQNTRWRSGWHHTTSHPSRQGSEWQRLNGADELGLHLATTRRLALHRTFMPRCPAHGKFFRGENGFPWLVLGMLGGPRAGFSFACGSDRLCRACRLSKDRTSILTHRR